MIDDNQRKEAAQALAAAEQDRAPIAPLRETYEGFDVVDAYEVQLINIRRRVEAGASIRGHKVGLSSKAMQKMMGVDEPDYGHLLGEMFVFEDDAIPASDFCFPRIEMEVAFVLGAPLSGPDCTVADVLRATAYVAPSLELVDSRIRDWKIGLVDTIADNASSARVIVGGQATSVLGLDLKTLGANLRRNGELVETGAAGAVLGNPAKAVAWLANKVHGFGVTLEAGHVILPGACSRAIDVHPGDCIEAEFDRLGRVAVSFT
jgi:2-keto-4-pentenoate hydratase